MRNIFILLVLFIVGCTGIASKTEQKSTADLKGGDRIEAAFKENRSIESPQPVSVNLVASGNAIITYTPADVPTTKASNDTTRDLSSKAWSDQSISQLYSSNSGLFYIALGAGVLMLVLALRWAEGSATGKALMEIGSLAKSTTTSLVGLNRDEPEHKIQTEFLERLKDLQEKLKSKK